MQYLKKRTAVTNFFTAVFLIIATICLFLVTNTAYARSYTLPSTNIEATINADGSLSVSQTREYDFDGDYTLATLDLGNLNQNSEVELESVSVNGVSLKPTEFNLSWRNAGGPNFQCYSFDVARNVIYAFGNYSSEKVSFKFNYKITNCVDVYSDVAEFYWKFVGEGWSEDSENVTATFNIPNSTGASTSEVRAWAHGPLSGRVSIDSASLVKCTVNKVRSGEFAEVRIAFPSTWMSIVPTSSNNRLSEILAEEETWANQANAQRQRSLIFVAISVGVALIFIALCIFLFFKFGKEYKPKFTDDYWRDAPEPGINPAIVGRLMRWNKQNTTDITSAIINLTSKGLLRIEPAKLTTKGIFGKEKTEDDYKFILDTNSLAETDEVDKATLHLLFDVVGGGNTEILFGDINKYAKDDPKNFSEEVKVWHESLDIAVDNKQFFDDVSGVVKAVMIILSLVVLVAGFGVTFLLDNFVPAICGVVASIVGFIMSHFTSRRTRYGAEVYAKSLALKKWLCEFTALGEKPPTDVKVWGAFMAYAFALGVSIEAIAQLKIYAPYMFEDNGYDSAFLPWYFWYTPGYWSDRGLFGGGETFSDVFSTTFNNTLASVGEAVDVISGGLSSGGGFGGGFSGGGGGGFGGGGGGAR